MTVISLIVVLLLEQVRPLAERRTVAVPLGHYARFFESHFNDGQERHGMIAWLLAVLPATFACAAVYLALMAVNPLLGFAWNVAILYLTLGFRQFSHYYTDIHLALRMGEIGRARMLLGEWRGRSADGLNATEIARLAMEEALVDSHRHVFAVVVWFVLLPGPAGALMYRLAGCISARPPHGWLRSRPVRRSYFHPTPNHYGGRNSWRHQNHTPRQNCPRRRRPNPRRPTWLAHLH